VNETTTFVLSPGTNFVVRAWAIGGTVSVTGSASSSVQLSSTVLPPTASIQLMGPLLNVTAVLFQGNATIKSLDVPSSVLFSGGVILSDAAVMSGVNLSTRSACSNRSFTYSFVRVLCANE